MGFFNTGFFAPDEKRGFINVLVLSFSFCLLFSAFNTAGSLQTSLNGNLGYWSNGILYIVFAVATFVSPWFVINFGEKITLLIGAACYTLYIGANIRVTEAFLFTASGIIGFGAALIWTAQGSVILHSAPLAKLGAYNGIFFGIFQWSHVIGNVIAGELLEDGTPKSTLFLVLTIVAGCSLIGFVCVRQSVSTEKMNEEPIGERLVQTIKVMGTRRMMLLWIVIIYTGISQTFVTGIFPATRPQKIVGWINAVFGAADVVGSFTFGYLSDRIGRLPIVLICGCSMTIGSIVLFLQLFHKITQDDWVGYVIAIFLGIADSGFNTQIYSTLGTYFPERLEASIGAFKFLQSGASAVLFFIGAHVKAYSIYFGITNGFLWVGVFLFYILLRTKPPTPVIEQVYSSNHDAEKSKPGHVSLEQNKSKVDVPLDEVA
eukprot:Phypoly_transcript_07795.p1 GENE.Phypoly_transcript_07795~~Phypoly_transcript_07795.p1  ORF type:complete len:431 (+),score=39.49 Phypoly_transcript_07795:56-1348(+)